MQIVNSLDKKNWQDFLDIHPHSNIFHTPEMYEVFNDSHGFEPNLWAVINSKNMPLALFLPVYVKIFNGLLNKYTTRAVSYGSILCESGHQGREALNLLLSEYRERAKNKVLFTELRNLSDLEPFQDVLIDCGFLFENHLNYLINLDSSPDELLQSFGKRTRKKIRRALRHGKIKVHESDEIDRCYELIHKSYSNANVPLADISLFEAAQRVLAPKGMVKFLISWTDDIAVAASAELIYKDTIYGWYGGVDRDFSEYIPNELLMWYILKWGAENGYRQYDFGGAGKPDEEYGVRDFKAKFGGDLVSFGRNTLVHSQIRLILSKLGYEIYRHLRV